MTKEETVAGETRTAYWHGVDVNGTARLAGITLQMGTSSGRGVRNTCALWRARPQLQGSNSADACAVTEPWITSFRGLASYRIPKVEVLASTTVRSTRTVASENASNGSSLAANYQIPNTRRSAAARAPAGGRVGGAEHDGEPAVAKRALPARSPHRGRRPTRENTALWPLAARRGRSTCTTCSTPTRRPPISRRICIRTTARHGSTRRRSWRRASPGSTRRCRSNRKVHREDLSQGPVHE